MQLTARQLNRATLARQSLLHRTPADAVTAVRGAVAVQAQSPASPYIGLWNRVAGFDPADLDAAFASGRIVRGNPVRMTLHAVAADEYRHFREATEPSLYAAKLGGRIADAGLPAAEAASHAAALLDFAAEVRTPRECETWLAERLGTATAKAAWPGIRQYAPLLRSVTGGPWSFNEKVAYLAAPDRPALGDREAADKALQQLVLRYLAGFGPASAADVAQFAMVRRDRVKAAIAALGERLVRCEGPGGEALHDLPGAELPDPETPAPPRLMAMWDNVFLAYHDRSRTIPPEIRTTVIRGNGDVLPMVLVDGRAVGLWRVADAGIEATVWRPVDDDAWAALDTEARALTAFLADREPEVYRRYRHWWPRLPEGETAVLAARLGLRPRPRRKEPAMSGREHHYDVTVRWTGNTGKGTARYLEYGRDHDITAPGKPLIRGSADPAFLGRREHWNPEDLLVASLSECHMLTYLALCARDRIVVTAYEDHATGTMVEEGGAGGRFSEVVLAPVVVVAEAARAERAAELHHDANKACFIANSVNFPVRHDPTIRVE